LKLDHSKYSLNILW